MSQIRNVLIASAAVFATAQAAYAANWSVLPGKSCGPLGMEVTAVKVHGFGQDGLALCRNSSLTLEGRKKKPNSCAVYAPLSVVGTFTIPTPSCPGASRSPVPPLPAPPLPEAPPFEADAKTVYVDGVLTPATEAAIEAWEDVRYDAMSLAGRSLPPAELVDALAAFMFEMSKSGADTAIHAAIESGQATETEMVRSVAVASAEAITKLVNTARKHGYESMGISIAVDGAKIGGVSADLIGVQMNFDNQDMLVKFSPEDRAYTALPHRLIPYSSLGLSLGYTAGVSGNIVAQLNQDFNICTSGPSVGLVAGYGKQVPDPVTPSVPGMEFSMTVDWPRADGLVKSKHDLPDFALAMGSGVGFEIEGTGIYTVAWGLTEDEIRACEGEILPSRPE